VLGRVAGLALGAALVALCVWLGAEGVALMDRGAALPAFTDPGRVEVLRSVLLPDDRAERAAFKEDYWREMRGLISDRWMLLERGRGFVALAATGLLAILLLRLWDARNVVRLRTPRSAGSFLLLGTIAWAGLVPAEWAALAELMRRGHLPYWADSVGLPALFSAFVVLGSLPVAAALTWLAALRRARLPAYLWLWDRARPVRSLLWTAVCGALVSPFAALLFGAVSSGRYLMIPLLAVLIYLVLAARAAVLSSADARPEQQVAPQSRMVPGEG
jgi:hypothetical protein